MGHGPVTVNKTYGYRGSKAIRNKRAPSNSRFSVNFKNFELIFGSMAKGEQGLPTEPLSSFTQPFLVLRKVRLTNSIACPTFFGLSEVGWAQGVHN
jgi:hypothetical protein